MNTTIQKLAKKLKFNESFIIRCLAEEQLYKNHYKSLKKINLKINEYGLKELNKVAKTLKITVSAVFSVLIQSGIRKD